MSEENIKYFFSVRDKQTKHKKNKLCKNCIPKLVFVTKGPVQHNLSIKRGLITLTGHHRDTEEQA